MTSYVYTATNTVASSANIATDKIRIATTSSPIHYTTGFPNVAITGTATCVTNSNIVTGVNTVFKTELKKGYWLGDATGNTVGIIASISSNTSLTLNNNAAVAISNAAVTYNPYGVPYAVATGNCKIIPSDTIQNSIIVGQGNIVSFINVTGATAAPFSITQLGMPHANTGTSGF